MLRLGLKLSRLKKFYLRMNIDDYHLTVVNLWELTTMQRQLIKEWDSKFGVGGYLSSFLVL